MPLLTELIFFVFDSTNMSRLRRSSPAAEWMVSKAHARPQPLTVFITLCPVLGVRAGHTLYGFLIVPPGQGIFPCHQDLSPGHKILASYHEGIFPSRGESSLPAGHCRHVIERLPQGTKAFLYMAQRLRCLPDTVRHVSVRFLQVTKTLPHVTKWFFHRAGSVRQVRKMLLQVGQSLRCLEKCLRQAGAVFLHPARNGLLLAD